MSEYTYFLEQFNEITRIDLSHYHQAQVLRRISLIMQKHSLPTLEALLAAMQTDKTILQECLNKLTIHVTDFFRDKAYWEVLKENILILAKLRSPLRIWSAGCSTGEEAYSLAGLLSRTLPPKTWELIATDLSVKALAAAKAGIYPEKALNNLNADERDALFSKVGGVFQAKERIRQTIQFSAHNLLHDPYPQNLDVVLCRNVIIYFNEPAKKHVIHSISKSLNPQGLLFIGSSEQIMEPEEAGLVRDSIYFYKKEN